MIENHLRAICTGSFAYWSDGTTYYYSQPRRIGSVEWPAEVVLVQSLKQDNKNLYRSEISVFPALSLMGQGMTSHLRMNVQVHTSLFANRAVLARPCSELRGDGVLNRQHTVAWTFSQESPEVDLNKGKFLHRLYMMAAFRLTTRHVGDKSRPPGHNIGALLVTKEGKVIAGALNTGWPNATLHAEVNLLQVYTSGGLPVPEGCFVYTTMKPCDMCAAMLAAIAPSCTVIYEQDDPGATGTIAPRGGMISMSSPEMKPTLVYTSDAPFTKTGVTLHDAMQQKQNEIKRKRREMEQKQPNVQYEALKLTSFVDKPEAVDVMKSAQRGLVRKMHRYEQGETNRRGEPKRPEVGAVLKHLGKIFGYLVHDPIPTNSNSNNNTIAPPQTNDDWSFDAPPRIENDWLDPTIVAFIASLETNNNSNNNNNNNDGESDVKRQRKGN